MTSLAFDTYRAIQTLQARGYTKDQAEGMVEVIRQIDIDDLATKGDIKDVLLKIESSKTDVLRWVVPLVLGLYGIFLIKFFGHM